MDSTITILLSTGTAIISALVVAMKVLWNANKSLMKEYREDRKEWIAALGEILGKQNSTIKEVSNDHDRALKELADKFDKRQGEINETMLNAFKTAFSKR